MFSKRISNHTKYTNEHAWPSRLIGKLMEKWTILFISQSLVELTMKKMKRFMNFSEGKPYGERYFIVFIECLISVNTIVNTEFNQ